MDRDLAERIALALEQIALELASAGTLNPSQPSPVPVAMAQPGGFPPLGWICPEHQTRKVVPAGVSQRTGQPYEAFVACGERGCNRKPPRAAAPARALPPGSPLP